MGKLPAGLLPTDKNIEIFADPDRFGKCLWISEGETHTEFYHLPLNVLFELADELRADPKAMAGLRHMNIRDESAMVEQYNYCNRGKLDGIPDITPGGIKTKEFFDCGRKGRCQGEGKVCSPLVVNNSRITYREMECLKLIGKGLPYKQIKVAMGFTTTTAVNSLTDRIRDKFQCGSMVEVALKVKELGIA